MTSNDGGSSTGRSVTYLTKARDISSPLQTFQQLSEDYNYLTTTVPLSSSSFPATPQQDMYGDFSQTSSTSLLRSFESYVRQLLNMDDGLFVISGVMAQEIALSIYCKHQNNSYFLCHETSHLLIHEQNGYQELLNLTPLVIPLKKNSLIQDPISANDVMDLLQQNPQTQPAVIIIECPHRELGGKITPWEDLVNISQYCRKNGIALHLDGARLWEATVAYQKSLSEICSLFDSVYVSFYKGLGGMTGAMLLGKSSFIAEARVWLRRFGGNIFTSLPYYVSAWAGLLRNINTFDEKTQRMKSVCNLLTILFQKDGKDQQIIRFDPEVPQVSLVHVYMRGAPSQVLLQIKDRVLQETSICCFTVIRASKRLVLDDIAIEESYFEFNMGPLNLEIPDELWFEGWNLFQSYLREYIATSTK